jgi:hypothetical protein
MADLVTELANRSGVSTEMARKGIGAVLSFLKDKIPAESFTKVTNAVPDSANLMAAQVDSGEAGGGGVLSAVAGAVGKVLGGGAGGAAALVSKLGNLGFSAEQSQGFLKNALDSLKDKVPGDVFKRISGLFPT